MNSGLKPYTKQITQDVGNVGTVSVNINPNDANTHLILPLIQTVGPMPITLSLIYDHKKSSENGSLFGAGFRLSLYGKLTPGSNEATMLNADGSTDTYKYGVFNAETQLTLSSVNNSDGTKSYIFKDRQGNEKCYSSVNLEYPSYIKNASGECITLNPKSNVPDMTYLNDYSTSSADKFSRDDIAFSKSVTVVRSIRWIHSTESKNETVQTAVLEYNDYKTLKSVTLYNGSSTTNSANIVRKAEISYPTNAIILQDAISQHSVKVELDSEGKATSVASSCTTAYSTARTTNIAYAENRATVTDPRGNKSYFCFDSAGLPLCNFAEYKTSATATPSNYCVVETEYDAGTKRLLAQSAPMWTNPSGVTNDMNGKSVADFTLSGVTRKSVSLDNNNLWKNIVGNVYNASGNGTLTYNLSNNVLGGEEIFLGIWGKQNIISSSGVVVSLTVGSETDKDSFKKTQADSNFDFLTLGVTAQQNASSIVIKIVIDKDQSIDLGNIYLFKKKYGTVFAYDAYGNCTEAEFGGKSTFARYNSKNLPVGFAGSGRASEQEYDVKNRVTLQMSDFGARTYNYYQSAEHPNNLTSTVTNYDFGGNTATLNKSYVYDAEGRFVIEEKDSLDYKTYYEYFTNGNLKSVRDAMNTVTELGYAGDGKLSSLLVKPQNGTGFKNISYTYYRTVDGTNKLLENVTTTNDTSYNFTYDTYNRLSSVKILNASGVESATVVKYAYTDYDDVKSMQYGTSGDKFEFEYDIYGQIAKVTSTVATSATKKIYTYEYNGVNQLVSIKEGSTVVRTFTYDNDGNVKKEAVPSHTRTGDISVSIPGSETATTLNALGEIGTQIQTCSGKKVRQSFDSVNRARAASKEIVFAEFGNDNFIGLFNIDKTLTKGTQYLTPSGGDATCKWQDALTYASTSSIKYKFPLSGNPDVLLGKGCVRFWFKVTSVSASKQIFIIKSAKNSSVIQVSQNSKKLKLSFTERNGTANTDAIVTDNEVSLGWNFVAINFHCYKLVSKVSTFQCALTLNNLTKEISRAPSNIAFETNVEHEFRTDMAFLALSQEQETSQNVLRYYRLTKDYIRDRQMINNQWSNFDFSQTTLYTTNSTMNSMDIFPLHNNLNSLGGRTPSQCALRQSSVRDRDRMFNFNSLIKRYAYVADGSMLEYKLYLSSTGTLFLRAYSDEVADKQYLFQGKDASNRTLSLYTGKDQLLKLEAQGNVYNTNLSFATGAWHDVGLSYSYQGSSIKFFVYADGKSYTTTPSITYNYNNLAFALGTSYNGNPLFGQIEMFAFQTASISDVSSFNIIASELKCYGKTTEYDKLGRFDTETLHKAGTTLYSRKLEYVVSPIASTKTSLFVGKDLITYNGGSVLREYTTDGVGRVTGITDNVFGSHTYQYDYRGYLIQDGTETITYTYNGNIAQKGSTVFTYDSNVKDRLISVGLKRDLVLNKEIKYDSSNPFNPISWNGRKYAYQGNKLTKFEYNGKTVYYLYNEKGQRIYKRVVENGTNTDTQYVYNGDLLVTQLNPNKATDRLDFAYDENGQLFAMIVNFASTYFYVKDSLGNILGLVDEGGHLYGKYDCTAFGKCTINLDNRGVATRNPFRFKGYYYDEESDMYYCNSRYYVPDWCRWLNADDVSNLKFNNPNGLNLFAYCWNDPIAKCQVVNSSEITQTQTLEYNNDGINPFPFISEAKKIYESCISARYAYTITKYLGYNRGFFDDMALLGLGRTTSTMRLANIGKIGIWGAVSIGANVVLDVLDSLSRGVSTKGVLIGAGLTLAKDIGLFFVGQGIVVGATALGSLAGPGGAVVGFVIGEIIAILGGAVVDYFLSKVIDEYAK